MAAQDKKEKANKGGVPHLQGLIRPTLRMWHISPNYTATNKNMISIHIGNFQCVKFPSNALNDLACNRPLLWLSPDSASGPMTMAGRLWYDLYSHADYLSLFTEHRACIITGIRQCLPPYKLIILSNIACHSTQDMQSTYSPPNAIMWNKQIGLYHKCVRYNVLAQN